MARVSCRWFICNGSLSHHNNSGKLGLYGVVLMKLYVRNGNLHIDMENATLTKSIDIDISLTDLLGDDAQIIIDNAIFHVTNFVVKKPCGHYELDEINMVLDGKTPPVLRCLNCGRIFQNMQEIEKDRKKMWKQVEKNGL